MLPTAPHVGIVTFSDVDSGFDLANALRGEGVKVSLFMSQRRLSKAVQNHERAVEYVYEAGYLNPDILIHLFDYPRYRNLRSYFVTRSLVNMIDKSGVDIVHLMLGPGEIWLAMLAVIVRRQPVVTTVIIPQPNVGDPLSPFLHHLVNFIAVRNSTMVIVNGASQVVRLAQSYEVSAEQVVHVPLYPRVTASKWIDEFVREETGTILFFGEARLHKGLEYLIRAQPLITEQVPNARILISSYGEHLEQSLRNIKDFSCFEIHRGYAYDKDVANYFKRASLVVLPYLSASTSGILGTAYAFGKPVVVTNVGCLPEYVTDGETGSVIPPASESALAEAIIRLLSDDGCRRRMGENAKMWIERSKKSIVFQTIQVYEKAVGLKNQKRK